MITEHKTTIYKTSDGREFTNKKDALTVERALMIHNYIESIGLTGGNWRSQDISGAISDNSDKLLSILTQTISENEYSVRERLQAVMATYVSVITVHNRTGKVIEWDRHTEILDDILKVIFSEHHVQND